MTKCKKKKHAFLLVCQVNREKKMFQGIKKKYKLISKRMKKSACIFFCFHKKVTVDSEKSLSVNFIVK